MFVDTKSNTIFGTIVNNHQRMRFCVLISTVYSLQFNLHVLDDERCFVEELPKDTQQTWKYRVEYHDNTNNVSDLHHYAH